MTEVKSFEEIEAAAQGGRRSLPRRVAREMAALLGLRLKDGWGLRLLTEQLGVPVSTYKAYERHTYAQEFLPMRVIKNLLPLFIGRGDPPITRTSARSFGLQAGEG